MRIRRENRTFRRLRRILCQTISKTQKVKLGGNYLHTIRKRNLELKQSTLPQRFILTRDTDLPPLDLHHAITVAHRPRKESERVVAAPLFPIALISVQHKQS